MIYEKGQGKKKLKCESKMLAVESKFRVYECSGLNSFNFMFENTFHLKSRLCLKQVVELNGHQKLSNSPLSFR